jgi:hypothetical protein
LGELKQFQLIRDTSRQQLGWTLPDTVNTVKCSWWWAETSPETCRANLNIWLAVHHSITFLLLPTWYTNFLFIHTNYIKLNSTTCFERNPLGWTLPDTVNTVKCSWWWAKTSPETCRANFGITN